MPVFKVWDVSRDIKKSIVANNVEETVAKACTKLNIPPSEDITLVLEEDGTVVDDSEVLLEFAGKVLLLLAPGQVWSPGQQPALQTRITPPVPTLPGADAAPATDAEAPLPENETNTDMSADVLDTSVGDGTNLNIAREISRTPLPKFSALIAQHLEGPNAVPEKIWSMVIGEAAHYYLGKFPNSLTESQHYRLIGQKMVQRYPSLGLDGVNPWSAFNKSLSQKIRHLRHGLKRKTQPLTSSTPAKRRCFTIPEIPSEENGQPTAEDMTRHLSELQSEWKKAEGARNLRHIKNLLQATRQDRAEFLKSNANGSIKQLFERYPCFEDASLVLFEFGLIFGNERVRSVAENMKKFALALENVMASDKLDNEDPHKLLKPIHMAEKKLAAKKGGSSRSIISVKKDVADTDIKAILKSDHLDAPRIVVIMSEEDITGIFLVADEVFARVSKGGVMAAMTLLMAMYYVFDLDYPKSNRLILGLLQTHVMNEPFKKDTTHSFKHLSRAIRDQLKESD